MGCGFELEAIAGLQLLMDRVGDREGSRAKQACITPNQADQVRPIAIQTHQIVAV